MTRIVAGLLVHNEGGRYLREHLDHLLDWVDEVRVIDDASTDDTLDVLPDDDRVVVYGNQQREFFRHEGNARQRLLHWTLMADPTHVVALDADEFVTDGPAVRQAIEEGNAPAYTLCMEEVWQANAKGLAVRMDGGWSPHPVVTVWRAVRGPWSIKDAALACGRVPVELRRARAVELPHSVLHFGWACEAERKRRHARYMEHDRGRFHRSAHLDSIMWPDSRVDTEPLDWPTGLAAVRSGILKSVKRRG